MKKKFTDWIQNTLRVTTNRLDQIKSKLKNFSQSGGVVNLEKFADEVDAVADAFPNSSTDELVAQFGCFTANTPVLVLTGIKPIQDIHTGDTVMSRNLVTDKNEPKVVTNLKRYITKGLVALTLSTGATVQATPNHPFYTHGSFVEASALKPGDTLSSANNAHVIVTHSLFTDSSAAVYNITVADNSNYFVSNDGILVHNDCMLSLLNAYPNLINKVNALGDDLKKEFMRDFEKANKEMLDALSSNGELGIEAWRMLQKHPNLRKNKLVIENFSGLLTNKSIDPTTLENALSNAFSSKVKGFGVENLVKALATFKNTPGIDKIIKDISNERNNFRKGAAFLLKKAESLGAEKIVRFEEPIEILAGKVRRYDMILIGDIKVECKSWSNFYESTIKKQFLDGDLKTIENFEDLRYFVDELSMPLDIWFENMKKFMVDNADMIWNDQNYSNVKALFVNKANAALKLDLEEASDLIKFIETNRQHWFDIIFEQTI